jgi:hypothetical protein
MAIVPPTTADDLLACYKTLSADERRIFCQQFLSSLQLSSDQLHELYHNAPENERHLYMKVLHREAFPHMYDQRRIHSEMDRLFVQQGRVLLRKYKQSRDRKPSFPERDAEIVRMRDEEGLSFGQIAVRLKAKNPKWAKNDGSKLSYDAVRKAYESKKKAAYLISASDV